MLCVGGFRKVIQIDKALMEYWVGVVPEIALIVVTLFYPVCSGVLKKIGYLNLCDYS